MNAAFGWTSHPFPKPEKGEIAVRVVTAGGGMMSWSGKPRLASIKHERRAKMNKWNYRNFLFFFIGWRKKLHDERSFVRKLIEPERAIRCRRTILATSAAVIAAWINDIDPGRIEIVGVTPDGVTGTITIGLAIILGQAYCWIIRYTEIAENGRWEFFSGDGTRMIEAPEHTEDGRLGPPGQQRTANLVSNRLATLGTIATWCIAGWWIWDALK